MKIIYGNEPYLIDCEISKIKKQHQETTFYYEWVTGMAKEISRPSLLCGRKAAILKLPELSDGMESLLDAECEVCIVIEKLDKRRNIYKKLSSCEQVKCNKLEMPMLKKFILRELSRCSMNIREDAFSLFLNRVQYQENSSISLYTIQTYIRQMCSGAKAEQLSYVNTTHVNAYVPENADEQVYHLTNALFQKNAKKYMQTAVMLAREKDSILILSALLRTFRVAYKASLYGEKTGTELETLLKVPAFQYAAVRKLSTDEILYCMDILTDGISGIKSGNKTDLCLMAALCELWNAVILDDGNRQPRQLNRQPPYCNITSVEQVSSNSSNHG